MWTLCRVGRKPRGVKLRACSLAGWRGCELRAGVRRDTWPMPLRTWPPLSRLCALEPGSSHPCARFPHFDRERQPPPRPTLRPMKVN